ncbi:hypothetical protein BDW22DRAFT_1340565, partial [Trametopsis cervina]
MLRQSTLRGIALPGMAERLITTLFADDTTVYLSCRDSYADLQQILLTWCVAAGATFNLGKTEIIPIGSRVYREQVSTTRRLNSESLPLPAGLRIAPEGEPTRILGVWVGNNIDHDSPWEPVLKQIRLSLKGWDRPGLTIFGRSLIINMEVGGRIQYLAKVQGMSRTIRDELALIIRSFIWPTQATPPVNMETLHLPISKGGIGLMDIEARLTSITLTWLQPLLDFSSGRPAWAFIADALIAQNATTSGPQSDRSSKLQVFLQNWTTNTSSRSSLPYAIRDLLSLAKKNGVTFNAIKIGPELKRKMPLWLH